MSKEVPDIQSSKPVYSIPIKRVGIEGVYRRVCLGDTGNKICLDTHIDMFVDLPKDQRGIHVSRCLEVLRDTFDVIELKDLANFEEAIERLSKELLNKHDYVMSAEVRIKTVFLYNYYNEELDIHENVPIRFSMIAKVDRREETMLRKLCIKVLGMSVCPCAQQVCSYMLRSKSIYSPSHTQRAELKICVSSRNFIDVKDIIEASLRSFSIPVFSYLKRDKECKVILKGFENPKFAEDIAREALYLIYSKLRNVVEPDATISIRIKSLESIHPFNMVVRSRFKFNEINDFLSDRAGKTWV
ncbi:MAG: GTP cyclohydrolase I FolE2 [Ignisphaera sp.]|uniref:GTP cyclohydrolase I FolE2 n=1 Tax=Ignisphaera aggregans TaxID=334771 RepID=A0A7C4NK69_9CREN